MHNAHTDISTLLRYCAQRRVFMHGFRFLLECSIYIGLLYYYFYGQELIFTTKSTMKPPLIKLYWSKRRLKLMCVHTHQCGPRTGDFETALLIDSEIAAR